ncbi:MAG: DUF86 domain-containing protein [Deltaproteobacteria bacterium]|nr:DUF86 domain-containing protein [Deltaproteobacteria bacterium]
MVDTTLIQRKIALLQDRKRELQGYGITSLSDLQTKPYMEKAVEKVLQEMVEICLDIGKHIIADDNLRLPNDTRDTFAVLAESAVLSTTTAELMKKMAAFRNLIVHLYEKIDVVEVYNVYTNHLCDFDLVTKEVLAYLQRTNQSAP